VTITFPMFFSSLKAGIPMVIFILLDQFFFKI
jgi:hypothetical protein